MTQPLEREGSLSFSLAELSRLEGDRLREQEERERRLRAVREERESHARREMQRREEEEALAQEEQRLEQERRAAEAAARNDALHEAVLLRAKAEADAAARARLDEVDHRHVEALARIRESEGASDWKRIAAISWTLSALACVTALVAIFLVVRPDAARRVAVAEATAAVHSEELRGARARQVEGEEKFRDLTQRLEEETRRARDLAIALDVAHAALASRPKGPRGPVTAPPPSNPPAGPFGTNCPPGSLDPLCGFSK